MKKLLLFLLLPLTCLAQSPKAVVTIGSEVPIVKVIAPHFTDKDVDIHLAANVKYIVKANGIIIYSGKPGVAILPFKTNIPTTLVIE